MTAATAPYLPPVAIVRGNGNLSRAVVELLVVPVKRSRAPLLKSC
jgi:hypothetical protein